MASKEELIQRWDSFLQKIEVRFNESLGHAEEACHEQLVATTYEYDTVMRSWSGMKAQVHVLIEKIDEIWAGKVAPEMEALGDFAHDEGNKAYDLSHKLLYSLEDFQRKLEGELSQKFYDHAIQVANKKASCSQCNADLEIKKDIFRAQYISCTFCNTVNTIAPETTFIKIGWGIVDHIAALKTTAQYKAMTAAEEAIRAYRGKAPASFWTDYYTVYNTYWSAYFTERMALNTDLKERYDSDMARKHKEFENFKEIQTK
ncbi:hypothetical protein [Cellulophaga baltica]|uniref:hypothetical protein n=1 Tax=Cellulophaga baltica TaxID=76594 RepID=UPI00249515D8|nr:hypothetical protein [Cellulophaga baltica]